ncbi:M20/M25/M40 family metallo-hydrolase [Luteimonas aquatica]|uniref:M20/M25/M40 family metallo-hydrolase n=1 Tax=Luteimonas aquatica TaxID=450364 RepID=UPI001F5940B1|nr:M20/M25/M40 family metallo-hydrolase [Luteimonas aquatica]
MRIHPLCIATALLLAAAPALAGSGQDKVWISLGDEAYTLLRGIAPGAREIAPSPGTAAGGGLHIVEVERGRLDALSSAIHAGRRQCGGFVAHASLAEAQDALAARTKKLATQYPGYEINNGPLVTSMLQSLSEPNLVQSITALSNYRNRHHASEYGAQASTWLYQQWTALAGNRSDIKVEQVAHRNTAQKSVVLTITGSERPNEIIVLGGHLDSIASGGAGGTAPGADDDASGIANLSEVIRVLTDSRYQPRRTLKFMAYAAEEVGLVGSGEIAASHKAAKAQVLGVLQLDMTNYKGSSGDIYITEDGTDSRQNAFLRRLASTYLPNLQVGSEYCYYACSDHASWQGQGYPSSFPFEAYDDARGNDESNPYIHTSQDTLDKSGGHALHALKFSQLALAYAVELGSNVGVTTQ